MVPTPTPSEVSTRTVIHQTGGKNEQLGPSDELLHVIRPQHPIKPPLDHSSQLPSAAATRDHAPLRPVYDDFATAHWSITSGSANSQSKSESKQKSPSKQTSLVDRGPQLPHQVSKPHRRQNKLTPANEDLKQPTAARMSHARVISEFDFDVSDVNFSSTRPPKIDLSSGRSTKLDKERPSPSSPLFNSLRKALRKKSSPASKLSQNPILRSSAWVRDSIELANVPRKAAYSTSGEAERRRSDSQSSLVPSKELQGQLDSDILFDDPFTQEPDHNPISRGFKISARSKRYRGSQELKIDAEHYHERMAAIGSGLRQDVKPPHRQPDVGAFFSGGVPFAGEASSMREGSTVDNILQEYGSNHRLWDVSLDSDEGKGEEEDDDDDASLRKIEAQSQINYRFSRQECFKRESRGMDKKGRMQRPQQLSVTEMRNQTRPVKSVDPPGQAPKIALPHVPSPAGQRTLQSSSDGIGQASSYGDTKYLLNLSQRSQWAKPCDTPVFGDQESHPYQMQEPSHGNLRDRNPYRRGLNKIHLQNSSAVVDSSPGSSLPKNESSGCVNSNNIEEKLHAPRLALDRDFSHALHRVSGVSNPSQEIPSRHKGHGGFQSSTDSSGFSGFIRKQGPIAGEAQKPNPKGFYHESAIHQTWLGSQQMGRVRIPVNHRGSLSSSLRFSLSASLAEDGFNGLNLDLHDEDGNDWETLPETGMASRAVTNLQEMVGQFNQAGSSVANTSDDGEISPVLYVHKDFSSTDRIIQHPAHIDYSLDYRQREIKGENFPVLLPCYQQHTVNGFPANSNRSLNPFQQSSSDFYYQQGPPLSTDHRNPFRRPLSESMNISQPSDDTLKNNKHTAPSSSQVPHQDRDILDRWINGFGDSQPELKMGNVSDPAAVVASSKKHKSAAPANSRAYRSSISDISFSTFGAFIERHRQRDQQTKTGILGESVVNDHEAAAHAKKPATRRPPGAFYHGVRSTTKLRPKQLSMNRLANSRSSEKQPSLSYPTNRMRPFSLLRAHPPLVGIGKAEGQSGAKAEDEFLYRSPLAPVKSRNWRNLYTREQLSVIRSAAKDDGICDIESQQSQSSRSKLYEHLKANGSLKRLPWSPRMSAWPRDNSSIQTDLGSRKRYISTLIFALCCLFPPVLILYGFGYMDNVMLWITDGEIRAFSTFHKRSALLVVCFFVIVALVAIPVTVVVTVPRHA